MNRRFGSVGLIAVIALSSLAVAGPAAAATGWQAVKSATARFNSQTQAARAGYAGEGEPCVESPAGAMGIHTVNPALASDLTIDPLRPEILLYLPSATGEPRLVAIEYFEVALAHSANGPIPWFGADAPPDGFFNPAPSVLGHVFDGPFAGHNPSMPWHYDLHVWLWADNPDGLFAMFNPALSCP